MTTLIIEDGTGKSDSNTYLSLEDARTLAASLGRELPPDDDEASTALVLGAKYLDKYRNDYQGRKLSGTQALQWPRTPVSIDGFDIAANIIPTELKTAQVLIGAEAGLGTDLMPIGEGTQVQKERVEGAVEVQYFENTSFGDEGAQPYFTEAMSYLEPLFKSALDNSGGGDWLFGSRV